MPPGHHHYWGPHGFSVPGATLWPMTTMHTGGLGNYPADDMPREERTSVLAILSLIFGIVCIPGFGVLGAILGAAALYFIATSGGRLAGRGLAIAGIVISLLFTFVWVVILWGASQAAAGFSQAAVAPVDNLMREIDTGKFAEAKSRLTGTAGQKITDEDFKAFADAYKAELGNYKAAPNGMWDWMQQMMAMGPVMQRFQGTSNMMPMPVTFDKDQAVLAVVMDPTSGNPTGNQGAIPIANIQVITKSGKTFTLFDPDSRPIAPNGNTPGEAKPEAPASPASEPPK